MTLPLKAVHMGPQLKMSQTGWRTKSPLLHPLIMHGPVGFHHLADLSIHLKVDRSLFDPIIKLKVDCLEI
jgi:hypothetical protein